MGKKSSIIHGSFTIMHVEIGIYGTALKATSINSKKSMIISFFYMNFHELFTNFFMRRMPVAS